MAARILLAWRTLTGGRARTDANRPTLVACSGGADSCALAIALAAAGAGVLAHVVHDLRPKPQALADRDAVRALARALGVPFVQARVVTRAHPGNAEAVARRLRYDALITLAKKHRCAFIATGHHADDQLETLLMRLCRGTSVAGLRGIAPKRPLAPGVTLIRPCLSLTRADAEALCRSQGVAWRTDATNADTTRLRSALRHHVTPRLRELAPRVAEHATTLAGHARATTRAVRAAAAPLLAAAARSRGALTFDRAALRAAPSAVVAEAIARAARGLVGESGLAPLRNWTLTRAVMAVRSRSGERKSHVLGPVEVGVDSERVVVRRIEGRRISRPA